MLLILFVFGLFLGSFINVLSDRLPFDESVIVGRSRCDYCKHTLGALDLIPLFSFALLRGRCRYCKKKLSLWYPAIELASSTVLVGTWVWMASMCTASCALYFVLFALLNLVFLALFVADAKYHILPDQLIVVGVVITLVIKLVPMLFFLSPMLVVDPNVFVSIGVGIALALFFLTLFLGTKGRGMGFGDVKLAFLIGLLLGFPLGFVAIYLSFLTGGVVAVILLIGGRKRFGQHIAFGPFMLIATLLSLLYSQQLLFVVEKFL